MGVPDSHERKTTRVNFKLRPSLMYRIQVARQAEGNGEGPMSLTRWVELACEAKLETMGLGEAAPVVPGFSVPPATGGPLVGVVTPPAPSARSVPGRPPADPRLRRLNWDGGMSARWRDDPARDGTR